MAPKPRARASVVNRLRHLSGDLAGQVGAMPVMSAAGMTVPACTAKGDALASSRSGLTVRCARDFPVREGAASYRVDVNDRLIALGW